MEIELKKYLYDVKIAIESIESYIGLKKDFQEYLSNKQLRRAVERELEIIGEAISRIIKSNPDISLSNSRKIIDTRNFVIHGYDKVDDTIIWGIVTIHLPKLKEEINKLFEVGK